MQYASEHSPGEIYITNNVNMPYIYVLFYERINPHDFQDSAVYANPGEAFQRVSSFGRYRFDDLNMVPANAAYIFGNSSPLPAASTEYTVKRFANYSVMLTKDKADGLPAAPEVPAAEFRNGGLKKGLRAGHSLREREWLTISLTPELGWLILMRELTEACHRFCCGSR